MSTAPRATGQHALITGGGRASAPSPPGFSRRGMARGLLDRDGAAAEGMAKEIGDGSARGYRGDVTDSAVIDAVLEDMVAAWGGVDDLVNNAGVWDHAPLLDLTLAQWRCVFDVNLLAPIEISKCRRLPHGAEHRPGAGRAPASMQYRQAPSIRRLSPDSWWSMGPPISTQPRCAGWGSRACRLDPMFAE